MKNKEKLPVPRFIIRLKLLRSARERRNSDRFNSRRTMAMVEARLSRWVAEGKHRLRYGSMDDILEDLGLTGDELCSYCSGRLGKTFLTWRKEIRMKEAMKLLLDSPEIPACKIGASLGIEDKSNFRHQFKSVTGYTPDGWRKKYQKKSR